MNKRELIELAQRLARNQGTTLPHVLGIPRNRVTNWKTSDPIPDAYAVRIAEFLDRDPALTLAERGTLESRNTRSMALGKTDPGDADHLFIKGQAQRQAPLRALSRPVAALRLLSGAKSLLRSLSMSPKCSADLHA